MKVCWSIKMKMLTSLLSKSRHATLEYVVITVVVVVFWSGLLYFCGLVSWQHVMRLVEHVALMLISNAQKYMYLVCSAVCGSYSNLCIFFATDHWKHLRRESLASSAGEMQDHGHSVWNWTVPGSLSSCCTVEGYQYVSGWNLCISALCNTVNSQTVQNWLRLSGRYLSILAMACQSQTNACQWGWCPGYSWDASISIGNACQGSWLGLPGWFTCVDCIHCIHCKQWNDNTNVKRDVDYVNISLGFDKVTGRS